MTRKEQLKKDLLQNFKDFQEIEAPGGSDEANEIVADGLANSIDHAIDAGFNLEFQGEKYCYDINDMEKKPGFVFTTLDEGVLVGDPVLEVYSNTVVMWDGTKFKVILKLVPADYSQIINEVLRSIKIDSYLSDTSTRAVQNRIVTRALNREIQDRKSADQDLEDKIDSLDEKFETKVDAREKTNSWGIGMRHESHNTLKFFRPNL